MAAAFASCLFALIALLTLLRIVDRCKPIFHHLPIFGHLVPSWSFFAPIPCMHDYFFFYRGMKIDGSLLPWQEVKIIEEDRPFFLFLWNPRKKFLKTFVDLVHDLLRFCNMTQESKQICVSLPYLHLLYFASGQKQERGVAKVQFMILTRSALQEPQVAFTSEVHPLPEAAHVG